MHLCSCGRGNPSKDQEMRGVGDPLAMHLSVTAGPGCRVWAIKRYTKRGAEAEGEKQISRLITTVPDEQTCGKHR